MIIKSYVGYEFLTFCLNFEATLSRLICLSMITHLCLLQEHCCSVRCVLVCLLCVEADQGAGWMVLCLLPCSVGNIKNQPQEIWTMGRYLCMYGVKHQKFGAISATCMYMYIPYSRKIRWELNLSDWLQPA